MKYVDLLWAPAGYWQLEPEQKKKICNGVGPANWGWLIPETIWGLSMTEAADIHDYMYHMGKTLGDKKHADMVFLNNMSRIIEQETWWGWLKAIRLNRAKLMYKAVDKFGESAFFANKDKQV